MTKTITIDSGDSIEKILNQLESEGVKPAEARFQLNFRDSYECNCCGFYYPEPVEIIYEVPEDQKIWERKLATYRKRLASWEEWAANHKKEIAAYEARKVAEKDAKRARLIENSRKALEKEKKTLEKRLKNLDKRLRK